MSTTTVQAAGAEVSVGMGTDPIGETTDQVIDAVGCSLGC
jgi:hypothetical protein